MTSQQIQNRALRREQVERYLATDMTVKEWCGLNHVSESTMYRWMTLFRKEEPGMFADPTCGEWIELSRDSIAARTALAVRAADEEALHAVSAGVAHNQQALVHRPQTSITPACGGYSLTHALNLQLRSPP